MHNVPLAPIADAAILDGRHGRRDAAIFTAPHGARMSPPRSNHLDHAPLDWAFKVRSPLLRSDFA
jgi:hypothetical protein